MIPNVQLSKPFWETKTLAEMTAAEWESLCDGCARCCLHKLDYREDSRIVFTNVACRLLDPRACRCRDYRRRCRLVPECQRLTPVNVTKLKWLPRTCAYRRLLDGKRLPHWHHLVCGDRNAVHRAGVSVRGKTVPERALRSPEDIAEHVIRWIRR